MERKKILITGTAGFIFGNFVRKVIYEKQPYTFASIDRLNNNSINSFYWNKNHTFYIADICDQHIINSIFQLEQPNIVIHGAALTHVDESIKDPNAFITNNVLGTQIIINSCLKHKIEKLVYISCYDEHTRAVTRNGFKKWNELKENDIVLSINSSTGFVEEKPIKKVIVQDYDGYLLSFNNYRVDLTVTPNHRMICDYNHKDKSNLNWHTAEELEKINKKMYLPTGKINKISPDVIYVPKIGLVNAKAFFYLCGVFIGDGFTAYQEKEVVNKSGYSHEEYCKKYRDSETGRFVNATIKNGSFETTICHNYRIYIDVPEKDKARIPLENALNILNIEYTTQKNKSGEHIYFTSKKWCDFFETCGKYAKNKQIPEWMFDYGEDLLKYLWQGLHDSDGHGYNIPGRTVRIATVSEKLTAQLCYLGSMIGYQTKVHKQHSESILEGRKIIGDANIICFSNKYRAHIPVPTKTPYKGKVWCLTVEDNKNFLIEHNGKITFCGNTDEVYGALNNDNEPSWTEDCPLNPRNQYSVTKAAGEMLVKAAHNSHGLVYNITRAANNYGPRQTCDKLLPKIIKCVLGNEKIPIYGKGMQIREWLSVFDNCNAILKIIEKGTPNEIYNISSNEEYLNIEIVQAICNEMGKGHDLINFITDPRGLAHDQKYSINCDKIKKLGWKPEKKFKTELGNTLNWYLNNQWFIK